MTLRCKPVDMALIIKSINSANIGKIVTCIKYVGTYKDCIGPDLWEVDRLLMWAPPPARRLCPDSCLMPIRPDEIKEERLNEQLLNIA